MPARLAHIALNAADIATAQEFYRAVFGWTFTPHGAPDFFRMDAEPSDDRQVIAVMQLRRQLLPDAPTNGFECTFAVDDVDAVAAAVKAHGGTILMDKATIPGVGDLIFFADPSGIIVGAMQFADGA